jgi:hypothetical protein
MMNSVQQMRVQAQMITPEVAKLFLEKTDGNRKISEIHVDTLARDMAEGKWKLSPQGIAFDDAGIFRDGHHRLRAVLKSGRSVLMNVFYDVPADTFDTIDQGRVRTIRDSLLIEKEGALAKAPKFVAHLLVVEAGTAVKLSRALFDRVSKELEVALDFTCGFTQRQVTAPMGAAVILAYDINPAAVSELVSQIVARDTMSGSPGSAIRRVLSDAEPAVVRTRKIMRGVLAHLRNEKTEHVKDTRLGYDGLVQMREKLGLPTKFM